MSDVSPYGVTQNANAEMVTANALVGEPAGAQTAHQAGPQFSPAAFSTAPYVGNKVVTYGCKGISARKNTPCEARPVRHTDYCIFHTPDGQGRHDRTEL